MGIRHELGLRFPKSLPLMGRIGRALHASKRETNLAMFHGGRSGSQVLGDLLDQHPDVAWSSEVFNAMPRKYGPLCDRDDVARVVLDYHLFRKGSKHFGFETKYMPAQHLHADVLGMSLEAYVSLLRDLGFTHFLVLERKNRLRQLVSELVGGATRRWHARAETREVTRVTVRLADDRPQWGTYASLPDRFRKHEARREELLALLGAAPRLDLTYEDDVQPDPRLAYRKTCGFLGVDPDRIEPDVRLKRTNPFPLRDVIENFDEVSAQLRGTDDAWMLDA